MNNVKYKKKVNEATIMIVEDHDALRDSLKKWLSSTFQNCEFLEAKSGEEAIELASSHLPDIVLMDIGLPKMSGLEATRGIKNAVPTIQVVILTIHDGTDYKADAEAAGAVAFIPKHSMHSELIPVVTKLLSHPDDNMLNFSKMKRKK
jgi:two-component system invasion response regulator UvrY